MGARPAPAKHLEGLIQRTKAPEIPANTLAKSHIVALGSCLAIGPAGLEVGRPPAGTPSRPARLGLELLGARDDAERRRELILVGVRRVRPLVEGRLVRDIQAVVEHQRQVISNAVA